jgi:hypothetical protein
MRTFVFLGTLMVLLCVGASTAAGGQRYSASHHGHYRGYDDYSSYSWGVSFGYPSPYWRGYGYYPPYAPGYPYGYGPWYGPSYGPGYGTSYLPGLAGSIGLGYSSGGHDAYSLFFSLPLYFGPSYQPAYPAPAPAPVAAPAQGATRQVLSDCLQTREYQTEIVIDGQPVPAYGTACLQADGSWRIVSGPFAAD